MHLSRRLSRLLLLVTLVATSAALIVEPKLSQENEADKLLPAIKNPSTGTKDALADRQDGKPHIGPLLPKKDEPGVGTGESGMSEEASFVDISKPPPVTGEHIIVDLDGEEGVRKEDSKSDLDLNSNLSKSVTTEEDDEYEQDDDNDGEIIDFDEGEDEGQDGEAGTISSPAHSFALSFIMILVSEIGDKTFLIAALMAMKHSRIVVFTAALASLIVMSILSAILGHAVPTLIPKSITSFVASGLFLVFGAKMLHEGLKMEKGTGNVQEEMKEVEQELEEKEAEIRGRDGEDRHMEEGRSKTRKSSFHRSTSSPAFSDSDSDETFKPRRTGKPHGLRSALEGVQNLASLALSPAWVQTFVMTFLGEWGDRSQIATIAMAAGQDYWFVTLGTITGHSFCTAGAVLGGRFLAEKISVRNVTLGGACAFLVFGVIYFVEALYL